MVSPERRRNSVVGISQSGMESPELPELRLQSGMVSPELRRNSACGTPRSPRTPRNSGCPRNSGNSGYGVPGTPELGRYGVPGTRWNSSELGYGLPGTRPAELVRPGHGLGQRSRTDHPCATTVADLNAASTDAERATQINLVEAKAKLVNTALLLHCRLFCAQPFSAQVLRAGPEAGPSTQRSVTDSLAGSVIRPGRPQGQRRPKASQRRPNRS